VSRFEIVIVYTKGMGKDLLGKTVQRGDIKSLVSKKAGGDCTNFRTLVLNGPIFRRKLEITDTEAQWNGSEGKFLIKDAKLLGNGTSQQAEAG
jgi:diphthamide synthase (EF-2-diphthine--ammonia ligase)